VRLAVLDIHEPHWGRRDQNGPTMNVAVTAVIATAGARPDLLDRTLSSLARCEQPDDFAVIVIENGRRGQTQTIVAKYAHIIHTSYRYCQAPNKSLALNDALTVIAGGLVVFFDDDIALSSGVLMAYAKAASEHGPGHLFGGPFDCDYERPPPPALRAVLPRAATGWWPADPRAARAQYFLGCNWAAFKGDIDACGGFDDELGPGLHTLAVGEETDLQKRLRRNGAQPVYLAGASVRHYVPASRCNWAWAARCAYAGGTSKMLMDAKITDYRWAYLKFAWHCGICISANGVLAAATASRARWYRARRHWRRLRGASRGFRILGQRPKSPASPAPLE
jgi:glycosyltransferase involved in cell wall biosynthesis